jgi:hypothetical protein
MADVKYHQFFTDLMKKVHDCDADSFKLPLFTDSHAPNADDTVYGGLANEHAASGNYSTGGYAFTGGAGTVTDDDSGDKSTLDITEDAVWASSTISARYAVLYNDTPTSPADPLVGLFDFGSVKSSSNGEFRVQFNANGVMDIA